MLTEPTFEMLELIADVSWNGKDFGGVTIHDTHTINACNHIYSGNILHDGISYGFVIESGDINGTKIHEWGLSDDIGTYEPEPPGEQLTFIPDGELTDTKLKIYKYWRRESWFKEMVGKYIYDKHFQPGNVTETYYRNWAKSKGLTVGYLSDIPKIK